MMRGASPSATTGTTMSRWNTQLFGDISTLHDVDAANGETTYTHRQEPGWP
jgi:hypothetical protein